MLVLLLFIRLLCVINTGNNYAILESQLSLQIKKLKSKYVHMCVICGRAIIQYCILKVVSLLCRAYRVRLNGVYCSDQIRNT